jgi:hypothetical protein
LPIALVFFQLHLYASNAMFSRTFVTVLFANARTHTHTHTHAHTHTHTHATPDTVSASTLGGWGAGVKPQSKAEAN